MRLPHIIALLTVASAAAAQVTLSPVPQHVEWGETAIGQNACFTVVGAKTADQDALRELNAVIAGRTEAAKGSQRVKIIIGERGDGAVSAWKKLIPQQHEGYYLSVKKGQIVVAGADEAGTFYAVQTLRQIIEGATANGQLSVPAVEITDWPDISDRGVVEGFYGNPWSHQDRLRQFDFYGRNKMNTYIYGPKDDPYHRDHWRTPYPEYERRHLCELAEAAHRNKVRFVWAVHPGVDIKWVKDDSINIVRKLESVYDMGVRSFAVFFDDIGGEGARAEKQAGLLNYITDEFVRKHDDVEPMIICPTEYNRGWAGKTYLPTLGKLMYPEVRVMWTGNTVVDMINEADVEWIREALGRKPYIWLNWPVNDYCVDHLAMGRTYGNDLTIAEGLSGFVSNPMEYAEASLVSLYSIADYTWHTATYDNDRSWKDAIHYLMPGHERAFETFCEYNTDLGPNGHGMRRKEESAVLAKAIKDGDTQRVCAEVTRLADAATELSAIQGNPMIDELRPWLTVTQDVAARASWAISAKQSVVSGNKPAATAAVKAVQTLTDAQMKTLSRDFEGSIKSPNPVVGSLVLEPYIKQTMREVEKAYRAKWGNANGLFRDPTVEDGQYYIVANGRRLTNIDANPSRTGDHPVFVEYNDTINPARQQWMITLDIETGRYKIANVQDGRYVNESGAFWITNRNPYDVTWHTYIINKDSEGRYSIRNAGSAGHAYWQTTPDRITRGTGEERFEFELIPVR